MDGRPEVIKKTLQFIIKTRDSLHRKKVSDESSKRVETKVVKTDTTQTLRET